MHRQIQDLVLSATAARQAELPPSVAERFAEHLARYCRLCAACDALEAFLGSRPPRR